MSASAIEILPPEPTMICGGILGENAIGAPPSLPVWEEIQKLDCSGLASPITLREPMPSHASAVAGVPVAALRTKTEATTAPEMMFALAFGLLIGLCVTVLAGIAPTRGGDTFLGLAGKIARFGALQPGWDGDAADGITAETVLTALGVLSVVWLRLSQRVAAPEIVILPFADGSIFFKLLHPDKEVQITVAQREIAIQRWHPLVSFSAEQRWEGAAVNDVGAQIEWLLR